MTLATRIWLGVFFASICVLITMLGTGAHGPVLAIPFAAVFISVVGTWWSSRSRADRVAYWNDVRASLRREDRGDEGDDWWRATK